ncbi:MAG: hypothetical protein LUE12_00815 [Ruminococcus sp.]|nr:hypothetical protein [Ruminococcus sp.]
MFTFKNVLDDIKLLFNICGEHSSFASSQSVVGVYCTSFLLCIKATILSMISSCAGL